MLRLRLRPARGLRAWPSVLVLSAGLAACAQPDHRAQPSVPAQFAGANPAADRDALAGMTATARTDAATLARWWDSFGDEALSELMRQALTQNLELQESLARIELARAGLRGARSAQFPSVNLGGSASQDRIRPDDRPPVDLPGIGLTVQLRNWDAALEGSWEVDLFGAQRARVSGDSQRLAATQAESAAVRIAVAAGVAQGYVQFRRLQALIDIATQAEQVAQRESHVAKRLFEIGRSTRLDVESLSAEALDRGVERVELQTRLAEAGFALDTLVGSAPGSVFQSLTPRQPIPFAQAVNPGQPAELLRRRPDVLAATLALRGSEFDALAARQNVFPKLTLNAAIGRQGLEVGNLISGASSFSRVAAMLGLPLIDFGLRRSQIEAADAQSELDYLGLERVVAQALEEVERALAQLEGSAQRARGVDASAERREHALRLAQRSYEVGQIGLADVLEAQRGALAGAQARTELSAARADAQIALFVALGGGWNIPTEVARSPEDAFQR